MTDAQIKQLAAKMEKESGRAVNAFTGEPWETVIRRMVPTDAACLRNPMDDMNQQGPCSSGRCNWPLCQEARKG